MVSSWELSLEIQAKTATTRGGLFVAIQTNPIGVLPWSTQMLVDCYTFYLWSVGALRLPYKVEQELLDEDFIERNFYE